MERKGYFNLINDGFRVTPIVCLLGPRQCGKTTLAHQYIESLKKKGDGSFHFFDLEDPAHLARLQNPRLALQDLKGLIVLDEIQRIPEIFPVLRVLADQKKKEARFLILGSASRDLIRQSSETLAGRITYVDVHPFSLSEAGIENLKTLWLRGGFPPSYLAADDADSRNWREGYIRTFLERDIPQLGFQIPAHAIRRFWMMLTHYHGQIFNASEIAKSLDTTDTTARRYLDLLTGTLMVRRLSPWFENISKRQVKRPKIYFRDTGILHSLLGVSDESSLRTHPKLGASWEGFALEEILRSYRADDEESFFWAVHEQTELDLLLIQSGRRIGFEIKYTEAPKIREHHRQIIKTLRLDEMNFVCPIEGESRAGPKIRIMGLGSLNGARHLLPLS